MNITKSVSHKITNSAIILRWNNGAGPGYGCWSIYGNVSLIIQMRRTECTNPLNPISGKPMEGFDEQQKTEHENKGHIEFVSKNREGE